jgi:hypothetical protein
MVSKLEQSRSSGRQNLLVSVSTLSLSGAIVASTVGRIMKNGLYSIHIHMLDGVRGRDSGVLILRDGVLLGGGPYFWSRGSYTVGNGTWKGELATNQHSPFTDAFVRPPFGGQEVTSGFSGTFSDDEAEVLGTVLVAGHRSSAFARP